MTIVVSSFRDFDSLKYFALKETLYLIFSLGGGRRFSLGDWGGLSKSCKSVL